MRLYLKIKSNAWMYGVLLNVLSVALMAWGPVVNKFAVNLIDAHLAAFLNAFFGGVFCLGYSICQKKRILRPKGQMIYVIGALNACGILCLFLAQTYLSALMIGFMGRFYTFFTMFFSIFILREKTTLSEILILGVAVASSFLLNYKNAEIQSWFGIAFIMVQTFLFATVNLLVKTHMKDCDSKSVLFYNNLISAIGLFVYLMVSKRTFDINLTGVAQGVSLVMLSSFLSAFLGVLFFYQGLKYVSFAEANLIRATSPILTACYSLLFFSFQLSNINILGGVILVTSIILLGAIKLRQSQMVGTSS